MSKAALSELSTLLRETVTHAGGKGSAVTMDKLAAQLSTRAWLLIGATPDLVERGRIVRRRDQQQFNWARDLVGGMLRDPQTADRVAWGLVHLLDDEIRTDQEEREAHRR
jgi:hypothetical protein